MKSVKQILIILLGLWAPLQGTQAQELWPGDVNNNGIVNSVDVLYWALARASDGPARANRDSTWTPQTGFTLWSGSFPDGLNFAYADCNGDGTVDDLDREIIKENFNQERTGSVPDNFQTGDTLVNPTLSLTSDLIAVGNNENVNATLSLGSEDMQIDRFFGIAFTMPYNPDQVQDQPNDYRFNLEDSWAGLAPSEVQEFLVNDAANGVAHVAIYRKRPELVSGFGELGTFNIVVVEDIVLGLSDNFEIGLNNIKMVDRNLEDMIVASSPLMIPVDKRTGTSEIREGEGVIVYPNPFNNELQIVLKDKQEQIEKVEVFNLLGQMADRIAGKGTHQQILDLGALPKGIYLLKINSKNRTYSHTISK